MLSGCAAVVVGLLLGMVAAFAPAAGAAFAQVRAEVGCDRVVRWTASASPDGSSEERTHESIRVDRRFGDGDWEPVGPNVSFGPTNDFSAGGSFPLPDDASSVALRVLPVGPWASGAGAGAERFAETRVPEACAAAPIAVTHRIDCAANLLVVSGRSLADRPLPLDVRVDGATAHASQLDGGTTTEVVLPIAAGSDTQLTVDSGEVRLFGGQVRSDCTTGRSSVGVLRRCTPMSGVLSAQSGPAPTKVDLVVGGELVLRQDVPAGTAIRHAFSVADPATPVEVSIDGRPVAVGPLGACDAATAGLFACTDDASVPCTDPVPTTPSDADASAVVPSAGTESGGDGPATLPATGPLQRAVLLLAAGALLMVGGGAVVFSDRSIREVSLLQHSVDHYRQHWWSED